MKRGLPIGTCNDVWRCVASKGRALRPSRQDEGSSVLIGSGTVEDIQPQRSNERDRYYHEEAIDVGDQHGLHDRYEYGHRMRSIWDIFD